MTDRCGTCGRDTVSGDCYGCEADRLRARIIAAEKERDELYDIMAELLQRVEGAIPMAQALETERDELRAQLAEARDAIREVVSDVRFPQHYHEPAAFVSQAGWNAKLTRLRRVMEE